MAVPRRTKLAVPTHDIEDLVLRIRATRWPDQLEGAEWKYGAEMSYVKELATYWAKSFDWRKQEAYLNSFDNYLLEVDDIDVHFIHAKSDDPAAIPLLLIHGWPGSYFEYHKCIQKLCHPGPDGGQAFNVVVPSLPGYGLSSAPRRPGFGVKAMAQTLNKLMLLLGYEKYVAQGGDWGGIISKALGTLHSDKCRAIHLNLVLCKPSYFSVFQLAQLANAAVPYLNWLPLTLSKDEISFIQTANDFRVKGESGYFHQQSTKPQTLAYGLNDSPVGLLAWIVEKFHTWTDCDGNLEAVLTKDELLTNVCLYWFTQRISSSIRIYYESVKPTDFRGENEYCKAPTAVAIFPKEIFKAPKSWVQNGYNLKRYTIFPAGGHFAALEKPDELVKDMRIFFSKWH